MNKPTCHWLHAKVVTNGNWLQGICPSTSVEFLFLPIHVFCCSHQAFAMLLRKWWLIRMSFLHCDSFPIWFVIYRHIWYWAPDYVGYALPRHMNMEFYHLSLTQFGWNEGQICFSPLPLFSLPQRSRQGAYGDNGIMEMDWATVGAWRCRGNQDRLSDGEYIFKRPQGR